MSSPESVSSKIANFGSSTAICKISFFFFSPPENPTFKCLWAYSGLMWSFSIFSSNSLWNCIKYCFSPVTASFAVLKKSSTVSPGISSGYWNDKKIPFFALSSTVSSLIFSPSKIISPPINLCFGFPTKILASVDFPAPFGPIITWTSPLLMFKLRPFKISFPSTSDLISFNCNKLILFLPPKYFIYKCFFLKQNLQLYFIKKL